MQDGESIKETDEAKRETIGQAHLFHTQTSTEGKYTEEGCCCRNYAFGLTDLGNHPLGAR